jgi:NADP-dependent 3-hydroxy acid dehydrogenase YdfG
LRILITGATAGIGAATARLSAEKGHSLILLGRRRDRLLQLQTELSRKALVEVHCLDLTKKSEVFAFCEKWEPELKTVDVLINNAGLAKGTDKLQESKIEDIEAMMQTNVMGLLYLTRGVLPHMVQRHSGHIVNIGSVAGRWIYPGGAVYCASKFAVRALTEGLRMDLIGKNIRVTNIEPGMVNTEFSLVRLGDQSKADSVYAGMKPLTAEDIAETIVWTLERPKHVNIQELVIYPTDQAAVGQVHRS